MNNRTYLPLKLVLCAVLASATVCAQYDTAEVLGTVHDPNNAPIPGATVTLLSQEREFNRR